MEKSIPSARSPIKAALRNRRMRKAYHLLYSTFRIIFLICIAYIILYPLLYMLIQSVSTNESFQNSGRVWIPSSVTLENYSYIIKVMKYGKALWSTVRYELVSALLEVCTCAVVAYGFSRFQFRFKKLLTGLLFLTILVPTSMLIIPLSVNFSHMDVLGILGLVNKLTGVDLRVSLINTPWAFWLPSLLASGLRSGIMIFIYMQFFKGLPGEFEEAAWVDGAGPLRTFLQIIVPSSSVVILTVTVFAVIWHWNDYQLAMMYTTENFPLAAALVNLPDFLTTQGFWMTTTFPITIAYVMCGCVLFVFPPLIMYMFIQRWFIESVDRVGITG